MDTLFEWVDAMSEQALYWFSEIDPKALTHAEFRVLNRLAWHHNEEEGCAWPSYKYLIAKTGISRGGLSKCMDSLERKGIIRREKREDASTLYYLNFEFTQETGVHSVNGCGSLSELGGVHSVDHKKNTIKQYTLNRSNTPTTGEPKKRRKPEVQLPEGWVPNAANIEHALSKGLNHDDIAEQAEKFLNYHTSKQSLYRDWDAAWRTWISNSKRYGAKRHDPYTHAGTSLFDVAAGINRASEKPEF